MHGLATVKSLGQYRHHAIFTIYALKPQKNIKKTKITCQYHPKYIQLVRSWKGDEAIWVSDQKSDLIFHDFYTHIRRLAICMYIPVLIYKILWPTDWWPVPDFSWRIVNFDHCYRASTNEIVFDVFYQVHQIYIIWGVHLQWNCSKNL